MTRQLVPIDHDQIAAYWDGAAASFDDWLVGSSPAEARAWELLWRRVIGPPPRRVLDVGCGTGSVALALAALGYEVTGVDASEAMLERARAKAASAGVTVTLRAASADDLPFPRGQFDAVMAKLVLWTMLDPEAAVAEWRRCARPGGRVAAVDISYHLLGPAGRARLALVRRRPAGGYLADPDKASQLPLWMAGPASYANVFARAGLERILVEDLAGIGALERARLPIRRRLWPPLQRHLVEGTVPAADHPERTEL